MMIMRFLSSGYSELHRNKHFCYTLVNMHSYTHTHKHIYLHIYKPFDMFRFHLCAGIDEMKKKRKENVRRILFCSFSIFSINRILSYRIDCICILHILSSRSCLFFHQISRRILFLFKFIAKHLFYLFKVLTFLIDNQLFSYCLFSI